MLNKLFDKGAFDLYSSRKVCVRCGVAYLSEPRPQLGHIVLRTAQNLSVYLYILNYNISLLAPFHSSHFNTQLQGKHL